MSVKLPFEKGSSLNFLYSARVKRGMTQKQMGAVVGRHHSAWCQYENAKSRIPESLAMEIPSILKFSNHEKSQFKSFLEEAEKRIERKEGSVGKKNHVMNGKRSPRKKTRKPGSKKVQKKEITGLSSEDKKNLRFLRTFFRKGGREDLVFLSKFRKFVARQK